MKETNYIDSEGRNWMVKIPDSAPNSDAPLGIPIGPPSLQELDIPTNFEISLHNELFLRRIFTSKDVKRRRADVIDAIKSAYKMDAEKIYVHYLKWEEKL